MKISKKLFDTVKLSQIPGYKLALEVGFHPNTLSKILHGAVQIKKDDPRLLKLAHILKIPMDQIWERKE